MNAKATWKEYSLAGGVSDDTTSLATDAFEDEVDRQLAGSTPLELAQLPGDATARRPSPGRPASPRPQSSNRGGSTHVDR